MNVVLAYLDPVTGSALLQVLLAAAAVVGLGYQYLRKAALSAWGRLRGVDSQAQPEGPKAEL